MRVAKGDVVTQLECETSRRVLGDKDSATATATAAGQGEGLEFPDSGVQRVVHFPGMVNHYFHFFE